MVMQLSAPPAKQKILLIKNSVANAVLPWQLNVRPAVLPFPSVLNSVANVVPLWLLKKFALAVVLNWQKALSSAANVVNP
jgi:hypothetical protein